MIQIRLWDVKYSLFLKVLVNVWQVLSSAIPVMSCLLHSDVFVHLSLHQLVRADDWTNSAFGMWSVIKHLLLRWLQKAAQMCLCAGWKTTSRFKLRHPSSLDLFWPSHESFKLFVVHRSIRSFSSNLDNYGRSLYSRIELAFMLIALLVCCKIFLLYHHIHLSSLP